jgi:hypothetical protein
MHKRDKNENKINPESRMEELNSDIVYIYIYMYIFIYILE